MPPAHPPVVRQKYKLNELPFALANVWNADEAADSSRTVPRLPPPGNDVYPIPAPPFRLSFTCNATSVVPSLINVVVKHPRHTEPRVAKAVPFALPANRLKIPGS